MNESAKEVMLKSFLHLKDKEIEKLKRNISDKNKQSIELEERIEAETNLMLMQKQLDEILSAFQKFVDSHEECLDFDGFTAQIVTQDDYHEACEAIDATRKEEK